MTDDTVCGIIIRGMIQQSIKLLLVILTFFFFIVPVYAQEDTTEEEKTTSHFVLKELDLDSKVETIQKKQEQNVVKVSLETKGIAITENKEQLAKAQKATESPSLKNQSSESSPWLKKEPTAKELMEQKEKDSTKKTKLPTFYVKTVQGVIEDHAYTLRVAEDKDGHFTKMRTEPSSDSKKLGILRQGDSFNLVKTNESKTWFYGEVIAAADKERIGEKGWIEGWILDGVGAPLEEKNEIGDEDNAEADEAKKETDSAEKKKKDDDVRGITIEEDASQTKDASVVVAGVSEEYIYTNRVAIDKKGAFTKMRSEADEGSERVGELRNGDLFTIWKTNTEGWYYGKIASSEDKDLVGTEGWIEKWLVTGDNVPAPPEPEPEAVQDAGSDTPAVAGGDAPSQEGKPANSINPDDMLAMINNHRQSIGKAAYQKNDQLCAMAKARGSAIDSEIWSGNIHGGFRAMNPPWWITENQVGMGSLEANFNWWMNSGIHRQAIESDKFIYSCGECWGGSCIQLFSDR